jgi:ERCC4-related helicase
LIQRIGRTLRIRPNHKANIFILVCKNTQDEVWLENAIRSLDKSKITYKMINEYMT